MPVPPRVYETTFTVPFGTLPAAPFSQTWVTEDNTISDIEIIVPPGHNGVTGIRVMKGDVQLLPWGKGTFFIASDYHRVFPIGVYLPTSDITIQGYNTGAVAHSFYLRMTVTDYNPDTGQGQGSPSQMLPAGSITVAIDPLSPDAILGTDTASAVTSGDLTAADVAPLPPLTIASTS